MEKLTFKTTINAPRNRVWDILWGADTYSEWTAAFAAGSTAKTDWQEGSKVLFVDDTNRGMVSRIAAKRPGEYMSFEHLGDFDNGVEDLVSMEAKGWAGAHENYYLTTVNGTTELLVELDTADEYKDYFQKTFPLALEKVKALAEQ